jgi:SAM-dependent methyltransferase
MRLERYIAGWIPRFSCKADVSMIATATLPVSLADPRCTTRPPSLAALSKVFRPLSRQRQELRALWAIVAEYQPQPPPYVWWHLARFVKTFRFLSPLVERPRRWLDISSDPWFCLLASKRFKGVDLVPTAMKEEHVHFRKDTGSDEYRYHALPMEIEPTTNSFSVDGTFDLVSAFEVLEHLQFHPAPFLQGLNNALNLGGRVVLTSPNGASWTIINQLLNGACPLQTYRFGGEMCHRAEYTTWEVQTLLESAGFQIERIQTQNMYVADGFGWRSSLLWLGTLLWHGATLQALRVRNLLLRSGSTMLVSAKKIGPCRLEKVVRV